MLSNAYDVGGVQLVTLPVRMVWDEIVLPNQVTQVLRVEPKLPCQLRCRGQARVHVSDSLPRIASAAPGQLEVPPRQRTCHLLRGIDRLRHPVGGLRAEWRDRATVQALVSPQVKRDRWYARWLRSTSWPGTVRSCPSVSPVRALRILRSPLMMIPPRSNRT